MKQQLIEDIAASYGSKETPVSWTEIDLEVSSLDELIINDEEAMHKVKCAVLWGQVSEMVERREHAVKVFTSCPNCGTIQVQLTSWTSPTLKYKCRLCKHRFERET